MTSELKQLILKEPEIFDKFIDFIDIKSIILFSIDLISQDNMYGDDIFKKIIEKISKTNDWDFCTFFKYNIIQQIAKLGIIKYKKYIKIILDHFKPIFEGELIEEMDEMYFDEHFKIIINNEEYVEPILNKIIKSTNKNNRRLMRSLIHFIFNDYNYIDPDIVKMIFIKCESNKKVFKYFKKEINDTYDGDSIFGDIILSSYEYDMKEFFFERIFTHDYNIRYYDNIFITYDEFFGNINIMKKCLKKIKIFPRTPHRLNCIFDCYENTIMNSIPFLKLIIKTTLKLKNNIFIKPKPKLIKKNEYNKYLNQLGLRRTNYTNLLL